MPVGCSKLTRSFNTARCRTRPGSLVGYSMSSDWRSYRLSCSTFTSNIFRPFRVRHYRDFMAVPCGWSTRYRLLVHLFSCLCSAMDHLLLHSQFCGGLSVRAPTYSFPLWPCSVALLSNSRL